MTAESPGHWEEKELQAAQKEDHQTLATAERLASTPDFSWPEIRGGLLRLLRRVKPPEVGARAVFLCLKLLDRERSRHYMKTLMLASSKPSR